MACLGEKDDAAHGITLKPPVRINSGKRGMRINLETNFFPIRTTNEDALLVLYEVEFFASGKEAINSRRQKLEMFELMKKTHPEVFDNHPVAFDADKKAYSVGIIPDVANSKGHSASYEVSKVKVSLTFKAELHLSELLEALCCTPGQHKKLPQKIIQPLEVMFRHYRSLKYTLVGRRHFFSVGGEFGATYPIGSNKEGVIGFFGSMRPSSWRNGSLLLNIDVTHAAFYKEQTLLDFVNGVIKLCRSDLNTTLDPRRKKKLMEEIKDLKIMVAHSDVPRIYRILSVTEQGANRLTFPHKDGKTGITRNITVLEYFKHVHGKRLFFPNFNCVQVAPAEKNIFLPMELCRVASGQKVRKLGDQEVAQFLRTAAVAPAERRKQICEIFSQNNFPEDPMLKNLRFNIDKNPLSISGRVLSPPKLCMSRMVEPHNGVWNSRNCKFFRGAFVRSWAVFNYTAGGVTVSQIRHFIQQLLRLGKGYGMEFSDPVTIQDMPRVCIEENFVSFKKKYQNMQLILVVLGKSDELYGPVKKVGDVNVGIITQCVQASTVQLCASPTVTNVLLKINAKMGGINNIIANPSTPSIFNHSVMIMGADVNHPSAGDGVSPSMAAIVASVDKHASMYAVEVMPQDHRMEIIQDLSKMVKNLILSYEKMQGKWPQKIVMYRDGVSESEFTTVLLHEVKAIRQACAALSQEYKPGITFLIVQKHHHARFFCHENEGVGKCKNIPPGTVVDSGITHPCERDFYLCSHQGIHGTTRPTHYHVLWDDNNMMMDELETLTYSLCHLYSRCTRAVSLPAPAYYAHLAAFRAKVHVSDLFNQCDGSESVTSEEIMNAAKMDCSNPMAHRLYYL